MTDRKRLTYLVLTLAVIGLCAAGVLARASARGGRARPDPPAAPGAAATCRWTASPERAAHELLRAAEAKIERYPFVPAEGRRALRLLANAERCASAAHAEFVVRSARARTDALLARLDADRAAHEARLARAIDAGDRVIVEAECRALLAMHADDDGAYVRWLRALTSGEP